MVTVNEPQVWTLIGTFSAAIFAMLGVVSGMFTRLLRAEVGSVRAEVGSVRAEVRAELGTVSSEIGRLSDQIEALRREFAIKFDSLDRDVQAIALRVFPERE